VELFIFVDDNAANVSNIYNHMVASHPDMKFIGIVADPYLKEPTHLDGLSALMEAGKPPMQHLTSESMTLNAGIATRSRLRRTRVYRRSRTQRRTRRYRR
jgi:hypothetical protein